MKPKLTLCRIDREGCSYVQNFNGRLTAVVFVWYLNWLAPRWLPSFSLNCPEL